MFRAVIFSAVLAGISAQTCVPQAIVHTETGDDLYRVLLSDLNDAEVAAATVSKAAQAANGCTPFQDIDFFTQLLLTITADNTWLDKLSAGTGYPTGDECVGVNTRIGFDLDNIIARAKTPIVSVDCPPKSGPALAQYTLQQFGLTLDALAKAPPGPTPPGPWQKYAQDLAAGMAAVRVVTKYNDVANCLSITKTIANSLVGIRQSGATTTPPPTTTTTTTTTTAAPTTKPY